MLTICLLAAAIVIVSPFYNNPKPIDEILLQQNVCEGFIDSAPTSDSKGIVKFTVKLQGCKKDDILKPISGRAQLTVNALQFPYTYGDIIRFRTHLHVPHDFNNPGSFKFERLCRSRGVDLLGYIDDPGWITKVGVASGHPIRMLIEGWRQKIAASLDSISNEELRASALALTIGDGAKISEDVRDDFRRSGLAHILVISGLNVAFVAIAAFFLLKWMMLLIPNLALKINIFKPAAILTIAAVWLYAYITGAEVSVVRAAIMSTVFLVSIAIDRRQDTFTSLAVAALIILVNSPLAIYDLSFQLSFVAVIAIAILYPRILKTLGTKHRSKCWRYFLETLAASIAATIGVAPLLSYYFHNSSFVGIIANIIAVPWAGFILTPFSFLVELIAIISPALAGYPAIAFGYLIKPLMIAAHLAASISRPLTVSFTLPLLSVVAIYMLIALALARKRLRYARLAMAATLIIFIGAIAHQHEWFNSRLKVAFLDVGQGSCAVVRFPDGTSAIIDGGGFKKSDFDLGKSVIAPYLWYKGISKIDYLILTHPHPDHFKGLGFIAEEFGPKELFWNGVTPDEEDLEEWNQFLGRIKAASVPMAVMKDNANFQVLNPPQNIPNYWNVNSTSLALKTSYGNISFLFTGDIEAPAEEEILRTGAAKLGATVMQIPHHGSATSSTAEFLNAVRPEYAVIQLGKDNGYGFPNRNVLERLNEVRAKIFRTDQDGAVEFETDGTNIFVE